MFTLKNYQKEAVRELKDKVNHLFGLEESKVCIFKAPTGSGKTLMMAEFLKEFVENRDDEKKFSFIWTAPRKLHEQSKEKLEKYFQDSKALKCSFFEDLDDRRIGENEVLFFNWESINRQENIYIRENEQDNNLSKVIENTKEDGRVIILIIDESHHAAQTETSQGLIEDIGPKATIEVSATPHMNSDYRIPVEREDVVEEGMIKKFVAINPDFKNLVRKKEDEFSIESELANKADALVLGAAIEKREELKRQLEKGKSAVNPLLLIQLPDRRQGFDDKKDEIVKILKERFKITVENGKLAIYLSENKENLENIAKNDNGAEVLIFKQAIALGWDCPRAQILVLFREWQSFIFSIQTVGRIMRMPELRHYQSEALNVGYVYTNLKDIGIREDLAKDYLRVHTARRIKDYAPLGLQSCYSKRFREETRLSPYFIQAFLKAAQDLGLKDKVKLAKVQKAEAELIADGKIRDIDKEISGISEKETVKLEQTLLELQESLDSFIIEALPPLYPEKRSVDRVREAIYAYFLKEHGLDYGEGNNQYLSISAVFDGANNRYFRNALDRAKEIYQQQVGKGKKELVVNPDWNIPASVNYNGYFEQKNYKRTVLQPFYCKELSGSEEKFIEYLESAKEIKWWFKNVDRDATYFAVPYEENGIWKPFYVDFIVLCKNGRIGLFDTKSGITAKVAGPKAEGLTRYIKEEKNSKKLFGGIAIQKGSNWLYWEKERYQYDENDFSQWRRLDLD
jgi:type III restriction enzyme